MITQLVGVSSLLVVAVAPLPAVFHVMFRVTARWRGPARLAEKILVSLVSWTVIQCLVVVCLGWIGHLRLVSILAVEAVLFVWGAWLIGREPAPAGRRPGRVDARAALTSRPERPPAERLLLGITSGVALLLCLRVLTLPITDWDSLDYQLPRVVQWYQLATFAHPTQQWGPPNSPINSYPYTWNTLFFIAMASLGHDQFVLMSNLLAWTILGLATYCLGRLLGGRRFGSTLAAVLVLLMPLSVKNVHTAHNDLPLGAFFVAGVYFVTSGWRRKRGSSFLMALLCVTMMSGVKMSGLAYAGLVTALALWLYVSNRLNGRAGPRWRETLREQRLMAGLVLVSAGLLGGSWYVRNVLVSGNPLGFVQIAVLGRVLYPGEVTQAWVNQTNLLHNFSPMSAHHWGVLGESAAAFLGLPALVLVGLALAAPYRLFRRPRVRSLLLALMGVCLGCLYLYVRGPWSAKQAFDADITSWMGQQMRYSFPFWGLVGAIAGGTIRIRPTGPAAWSLVGLAAIGAIAATTEGPLWSSKSALVVAAVALFVSFAGPVVRRHLGGLSAGVGGLRGSRRRLGVIFGGVALVSVAVITVGSVMSLGWRDRFQHVVARGISRFIDDLPAGTRIGFWGTHQSYLLYGSRLERSPRYLPLDEHASADAMIHYLRAQAIGVVAVGPRTPFNESSPVWRWMAEKSGHFERLHGEDLRHDVFVYRLSWVNQ